MELRLVAEIISNMAWAPAIISNSCVLNNRNSMIRPYLFGFPSPCFLFCSCISFLSFHIFSILMFFYSRVQILSNSSKECQGWYKCSPRIQLPACQDVLLVFLHSLSDFQITENTIEKKFLNVIFTLIILYWKGK